MYKNKMLSRPVPPKSLSRGLRSIPSTYESSIVLVLDPNLRYMNELKNLLNKVFSSYHKAKANVSIMVSGSLYRKRMPLTIYFFFHIFLKVLLEEVTEISNPISG